MLFSERFDIPNGDDFDWFNPNLLVDTLLFVDPFLIFDDDDESWKRCHDKLLDYFQNTFRILAEINMNRQHQKFARAIELMVFPEPREFRLGFSASTVNGSGSGKGLAKTIIDVMCETINLGMEDIKHFEELGILTEGINRDRISDITCNLLKPQFIEYTQDVCVALGVPLQTVSVDHSIFSDSRSRWVSGMWNLPVDDENLPVILVPKRFLRELPSLSSQAWGDYADSSLRDDLNLHLSGNLDKKAIIKLARSHPESIERWVENVEEHGSEPYDLDNDPKLVYKWYTNARELVNRSSLKFCRIQTPAELDRFISESMGEFKHYVEEQGGWRLLWDSQKNNSVPEMNIQLLIKATLSGYCEKARVALDREVDLGRGPVDFVLTSYADVRRIIEVKKLENGKFWHGVNFQTPSYVYSDKQDSGWLIVVKHSDSAQMRDRARKLPKRLVVPFKDEAITLNTLLVDATPKDSASNITPEEAQD